MIASRVREILDRASGRRFLVIGDLILDEFLWGEVSRISPEAPVPVVRLTGESWYPGGAANVARNVRELAPQVSLMGAVGDDDAGRKLIGLLESERIGVDRVTRLSDWSTIVKTRIIARQQQVVRVDREQRRAGSLPHSEAEIEADAVIVSDYAKGFIDQGLADRLGQSGVSTITVDPSPANPVRWSNVTAIKPNRSEALKAAGVDPESNDDVIERVGFDLLGKWSTKLLLLTLGEKGMFLFQNEQPVYHTPTRAREVFDVSGAGDTAISVFTVALAGGATPTEAAELANEASGIVVGKLGTAVVTREELLARYE
jgi:D-beta-D-heptose 7-phosphate kinase/D-beta-D-heptose 1-phosphate adenosyltransferase